MAPKMKMQPLTPALKLEIAEETLLEVRETVADFREINASLTTALSTVAHLHRSYNSPPVFDKKGRYVGGEDEVVCFSCGSIWPCPTNAALSAVILFLTARRFWTINEVVDSYDEDIVTG